MAFAISSPSVLISSGGFFSPNVASSEKLHSGPATIKLPRRSSTVTAAYVSDRTERVHVASSQPFGGSLYGVLGIETGATCQEIKAAYRRLARVVHPDVANNGTNGQSSSYEFMKVHEAYTTLSDPDRRADYDRILLMHRLNSSLAMTPSITGVSRSTASRYGGFATRKNWETDQCW